jgi:hypothetical protein
LVWFAYKIRKIDILLKQSIQLVQENLREDQLKDKKLENLIFESLNLDKGLLSMMVRANE